MERDRRLQLIQRSLGLRHKLKVHESMKTPDTHEELSLMLMTKWEYEDELRAIEEILAELRQQNIAAKKTVLLKDSGAVERRLGKKKFSAQYAE